MTIVKVCGITNLTDALCAVDAGADMLGFIVYPRSPRYIAPAAIAQIAEALHQSHPAVKLVGVFVNETAPSISAVLSRTGLDYAQLSGDEQPGHLSALANRSYKAIRSSIDAGRYIIATQDRPDRLPDLLLDADHPTLYGGSGLRADESLAQNLAKQYHLLLAGGLKPENVAQVIQLVHPWGVDVASGVESTLGRKDHAKVREFVRAAKMAVATT